MDVRLNNRSQLAGFAKRDDLKYFSVHCVEWIMNTGLILPRHRKCLSSIN